MSYDYHRAAVVQLFIHSSRDIFYGLCCKLLKMQTRNFPSWASCKPDDLLHSVPKDLGVQGPISFCPELELKCNGGSTDSLGCASLDALENVCVMQT